MLITGRGLVWWRVVELRLHAYTLLQTIEKNNLLVHGVLFDSVVPLHFLCNLYNPTEFPSAMTTRNTKPNSSAKDN